MVGILVVTTATTAPLMTLGEWLAEQSLSTAPAVYEGLAPGSSPFGGTPLQGFRPAKTILDQVGKCV